ncbi:MAG: hypothetical protein L0215_14690 [Gemmataceae bacterium]|nr:hypothetical protein [Gemmataceae bacterium]
MCVVVVVQRQCDLFELILTLRTRSGFAHFSRSRQEQANQNRNDGDYDKELDQRKTEARFHVRLRTIDNDTAWTIIDSLPEHVNHLYPQALVCG